jgi:ATP-dependent Clp protease ATP-binding subunit ClpA
VVKQYLAPAHHVEYPKDVIEEAVRLSVRYLHDEFLPGKVIKLLDQAGPRVTMGGSLRGIPIDMDQTVGGVVTLEIIRKIVSERTGIPLTSLSQSDRDKILNLEATLKERVKGQDDAISEVVRVVKRSRAGLADPRRPLGTFLFAGPTGVGKTELALALAEAIFDQEDAILRLDMSEYLEKHQISRLIGSPPGYVGYEEESQLTGRLRRRPYSVILLDEIEKAHKDVQHLFLQLFDAGRITDSRGHVADGRNAIFIMTTNLGAKEAMGLISDPRSYKEKLQTAIEEHFSAEFLNRISRIVYFNPLTEELMLAVFDKFFDQAIKRFEGQGIKVEVTEGFKRELCSRCAKMNRGARPLQRAIEDEIISPLADKIISGEIDLEKKIIIGN